MASKLKNLFSGEAVVNLFGEEILPEDKPRLQERFGVPPFSVLDARQGYWQDRKREWIKLGITSADGRDDVLFKDDIKDYDYMRRKEGKRKLQRGVKGVLSHISENTSPDIKERFEKCGTGASIFDPVLCELAYTWFCPEGGKILDPFAGGSVRGIVAEQLCRKYTGIELRQEQIEANRKQAEAIGCTPTWLQGDSSQIDELLPKLDATKEYENFFDMIFSCPPYYDLEQYSESKDDGSAKQSYTEFIQWYEGIFRSCIQRLKWNRFVVIVVGEIRDEEGFYRNFVGDTVQVMLRCGLRYYNEAIFITRVGSLPLRVNSAFGGYRKLGKSHQNVLVFYYGNNCEQINEKFGKLL
jgi:DNA modification methylase